MGNKLDNAKRVSKLIPLYSTLSFKLEYSYLRLELSMDLKILTAIVQAVSRWLPTAAARVRVRAEHVGFVVDKAALG
jgi:hypothetical protein